MALASLSRSLLSKMSISGSGSGSVPSLATSSSTSSEGGPPSPQPPLSVVGGNHREGSVVTDDSSFLSSGFSPIRNMELYPPRAKVIEEGCEYEDCPLPLLPGESVEYLCGLMEGHLLYLTNYRLIATQLTGFYSVPLGMLEGIEMQAVKETLTFLCRDARIFRLIFPSPFKARSFLSHIQLALHPPTDYKSIFAFVYKAYDKDLRLAGRQADGPGKGSLLLKGDCLGDAVTQEYSRMGMEYSSRRGYCTSGRSHGSSGKSSPDGRVWRVSQCNSKYEVCPTYPKLLIVPQSVSDEELLQVSKFRTLGRFPVVVWRHPCTGSVIARSSQPLVGVLSWRSSDDEKILNALSQACLDSKPAPVMTPYQANNLNHKMDSSGSHQVGNGVGPSHLERGGSPALTWDMESEDGDADSAAPRLVVMDLRSYTATLGNRAKGGGSECTDYYPNCEVQFKGLPNIHSVRKSFMQLRTILSSDDQNSFLSNLESTQWLSYLCQLLGVACEVVGVVHDAALPILIHCSDGWDRTTQVVALAQLMLDPHYRTIQGFQLLVEREWLAYGHKFGDRCGHTSEDTNQRSPVFLQWLDCVHQLTRQFPCDFQFNELFLLKLGQHVYSCLFGTFLGNSVKEREAWRIQEDSASVWSLLHQDNVQLTNYLYEPPPPAQLKVLKPVANIQSMLLWRAMYCDPPLSLYFDPQLPNQDSWSLGDEEGPGRAEGVWSGRATEGVEGGMRGVCQAKADSTDAADSIVQEDTSDSTVTTQHSGGVSGGGGEGVVSGGLAVGSTVGEMESGEVLVEGDVCTTPLHTDEARLSSSPVRASGDAACNETTSDDGVATDSGCVRTGSNGAIVSDGATGSNGASGSNGATGSNGAIVSDGATGSDGSISGGVCEDMGRLSSRLSEHDFHESLHVLRSESTTEGVEEGAGPDRVQTTPNGVPDSLHASSPAAPVHDDEYLTLSPTLPRHGIPAAMMEMLPMQKNVSSSSNVVTGIVEATQDGGCGHEGVKAYDRESFPPRPSLTSNEETNARHSKFRVDVDGLPCFADSVHNRLKVLEATHKAQLKKLQQKLKEAKIMVALAVKSDSSQLQQLVKEELRAEDREVTESVSSIASWDYVDEDGEGLRWIPDHAVTNCFGCGTEFWTAKRKHHCRSCGKVFCGSCSDFFCQVLQEQLFENVRVCEKCFYKLDGHLQQKSGHSQAPS